jgi:hypothetical protein
LVDSIGFFFSKDSTGGHFKKFQIFLVFLVASPKNRFESWETDSPKVRPSDGLVLWRACGRGNAPLEPY